MALPLEVRQNPQEFSATITPFRSRAESPILPPINRVPTNPNLGNIQPGDLVSYTRSNGTVESTPVLSANTYTRRVREDGASIAFTKVYMEGHGPAKDRKGIFTNGWTGKESIGVVYSREREDGSIERSLLEELNLHAALKDAQAIEDRKKDQALREGVATSIRTYALEPYSMAAD
jgi:hypothetical protein